VTANSKGTSLLHHRSNYGREKFHDTGPKFIFMKLPELLQAFNVSTVFELS